MPGKNTPTHSHQTFIGACTLDIGAALSIPVGNALEYSEMRAAQLSSGLHIICGVGGEASGKHDPATQDRALWLACSLANELKDLLQLVHDDARAEESGKEGN